MAEQPFSTWRPNKKSAELLSKIKPILETLYSKGYRLTLRQLHYQLVSANITPNTQASYNTLGRLLSDARMAGLIDWDYIEDRHRSTIKTPTWANVGSILQSAAYSYRRDCWLEQPYYIEILIEKDALSGVVQPVCSDYRVPFMACKGYLSMSAKYLMYKRMQDALERDKKPLVLYLGDHDPSGLNMPAVIEQDLETMVGEAIEVKSIALTKEQILTLNLPPNFAKETDPRFAEYEILHGPSSWELDALPPDYIAKLVKDTLGEYINFEAWGKSLEQEKNEREVLLDLAKRMPHKGLKIPKGY